MSRLRDVLFTVVLFGATVLVLGFLVLPRACRCTC
jgi:hypothetical protein